MDEGNYKMIIDNLKNQTVHDKTLIEQLGVKLEYQEHIIITILAMMLDKIKQR